jgi:F-type H+-transporting ATPase subunit delta
VRVSTDGRVAAAVRGQPRAIARRYAKALLEVARAQGLGVPAALHGELSSFAKSFEASPELRRALQHPTLRAEARRKVVGALAETGGASPLLRRLLDLVATRDRLELLPALAEEYAEARNAAEGRVSAEAVTAVPLADTQKAGVSSALSSAIGKAVELRTRVDPALLGGVLVKLGGRSYDGTVRGQLAALRVRLASGS